MKLLKCKFPLSVTAILITSMALASVIFTENLRALTGTSIFKLKACPKENAASALYKGNINYYIYIQMTDICGFSEF